MMSFTLTRNRLVVLALCVSFSAVADALAQDVRIETQQQARARNQNTLDQQVAPEDASDSELGEINLVSRAPRPKMFTFSTLQTLNYSSNAFLVRDDTKGDFFWNGGLGASFVPYATRNFTPRLTFSEDLFRYDDFSELDFDAQTLQLDLKYDLNRDDTWYVNGSFALARLSSPDAGEFYRYGLLSESITHLVQLRTAPVIIGVSGGVYWRLGDPSPSDRVGAYLNAHPDTTAYFDMGFWHAGVAKVLKDRNISPGKVLLGGFDLVPQVLEMMKAGYIQVEIDQQPYEQGFLPVMEAYLKKNIGLAPADIDTGEAVITADQVDAIMALSKQGKR